VQWLELPQRTNTHCAVLRSWALPDQQNMPGRKICTLVRKLHSVFCFLKISLDPGTICICGGGGLDPASTPRKVRAPAQQPLELWGAHPVRSASVDKRIDCLQGFISDSQIRNARENPLFVKADALVFHSAELRCEPGQFRVGQSTLALQNLSPCVFAPAGILNS